MKYIIIGNSRSGKTTLAGQMMAKSPGSIFLDVVDYVFRFIRREGIPQNTSNPELLKIPYEDLCRDLEQGINWDILELASDYPEIFLPRIISTTPKPVKVIFCRCPLDVCLRRNREDKRLVPEEIIKFQNQYDENFYRGLTTSLGIDLIVHFPLE